MRLLLLPPEGVGGAGSGDAGFQLVEKPAFQLQGDEEAAAKDEKNKGPTGVPLFNPECE